MTLTIELTPQTASRLKREARRQGVDAAEYARRLLDDSLKARVSRRGQAIPLEEAMRLYDQRAVSLEIAARIAGVSQQEFIDALGRAGISVFQYTAEEVLAEAQIA